MAIGKQVHTDKWIYNGKQRWLIVRFMCCQLVFVFDWLDSVHDTCLTTQKIFEFRIKQNRLFHRQIVPHLFFVVSFPFSICRTTRKMEKMRTWNKRMNFHNSFVIKNMCAFFFYVRCVWYFHSSRVNLSIFSIPTRPNKILSIFIFAVCNSTTAAHKWTLQMVDSLCNSFNVFQFRCAVSTTAFVHP